MRSFKGLVSGCGPAFIQGVAVLGLCLVLVPTGLLTADPVPCTFVRGDIVGTVPPNDPVVDLNDGVDIIAFLFIARSVPECMDAADINDNGLIELSDYTYLVNWSFNGGPPPSAPFPTAGTDTTPGITVPAERDPRFTFKIGTSAGVPNNTGIAVPVTLTNEVPVGGVTMVFQYDPLQIRIDEIITEENTILSAQNAEYIIAEFHNAQGVAYIASLKDFATPFWFQDGSDPNLPAGTDQVVGLLKCGIVVAADMGFAQISFVDGVKIPNSIVPPYDPAQLPDAHNLVMLDSTVVRPVLATGGGIDIRRGFIRGDVNKDDEVDLSDPVFLLAYIFRGQTHPPCEDAGDANNDTRLDISDSIWILNYLFKGGPQPSEPFPQPGVDPSDDGKGSLGCESDHP